jgi:hypothetical protein
MFGKCHGHQLTSLIETINFVHAGICPYFKATTYEEAYGNCGSSEDQSSPEQNEVVPAQPSSSKAWWWQGPNPTSFSPIRGGYWPRPSTGAVQGGNFGPQATSIQAIWEKTCDGPTTFAQGTRTWTVTEATIVTISDAPIIWTKALSSGTWAPLDQDIPATATTTADAQQTLPTNTGNGASAETTPFTQPFGATAAGSRTSSATFGIAPAQFTGAASKGRTFGAVAAMVAIGAVIAI